MPNKEIEIKYRILQSDIPILSSPTVWQHFSTPINIIYSASHHCHSVYYDTKDLDLLSNGIVYRIRAYENTKWEATVKAKSKSVNGLSQRKEYNIDITRPEPSVKHFSQTEFFATAREILLHKTFLPLFTTSFCRTATLLEYQLPFQAFTRIEVAVDQGCVKVNEKYCETIYEMELELKDFSAQDEEIAVINLQNVGTFLQSSFHLSPYDQSKFSRGLNLYRQSLNQ